MDHDDVEHLFSWLQNPELRYREFAGAREITDTVVLRQVRVNSTEPAAAVAGPPVDGDGQLEEEYPPDQFPDQSNIEVVVEPAGRGKVMVAPMLPPIPPPPVPEPPVPQPAAVPFRVSIPPPLAAPPPAGPFALGAGGRAGPRAPLDTAPPSLVIQTPAPRPTAAPPSSPPQPAAASMPPGNGHLLGGVYRANGSAAGPAPHSNGTAESQRREQSLDAVFGRLAGRGRLPDPRDRLRHGLGPAGRSR